MPRVLIDTDIFSEIFKKRDPNVVRRAVAYQAEHGSFSITVITAMEITSGLHRVRATAQIARFEAMLAGCEVAGFDEDAAVLAGQIDAVLRLRGTRVDLNDIMIAAIAIRERVPLVTGNTAHFETIRDAGFGLTIENGRVEI
jgi:tRNA(fMet)-specific endonuclease VapC